MEVLLQLLEFFQHVVVDGGVAETPTHATGFFIQLAHRYVLATRRRTRNAQTLQDRGVDAVEVALDYLHAQCLTSAPTSTPIVQPSFSTRDSTEKESERTKEPEEQRI